MNSTLKIEINGVPITGRIEGIDNFVINYRQNDDDGTQIKSYSSELTFYDDGYQILNSLLVNNTNGFNERVPVKIYDDCCGNMVFEGWISGDSIDWCEPECWISGNIVQKDEELACIKNTIIWDNWNGFLNQQYNRVDYCVEMRPVFIQAIVWYFSYLIIQIITVIFVTLVPIIAVITGILLIFGGNFGLYDYLDWINQIYNLIAPCSDYHVAPYLRDYIKNACEKCGLTFRSSILNDQNGAVGSIYWNTVLLSMQVKRGREANLTDNTMIRENLPVETLETLFNNYLNPLFNARWKVLGNEFVFERRDYFGGISQWIDADQLLNDGKITENRICWKWQDRQRYAYGRFEYQMDAMEYIGNEAKNQYNDLVDWNNPYSSSQTGELARLINISPLRVVDDCVGGSFYGGIHKGKLVMAQHTAFNYKIFIYNDGPHVAIEKEIKTNYSDAFVQPFGGNIGCPPALRYNYPFWFVEGVQGVSGFQNNLYSLFHYIDDPRLPTATQFDFNFTFEFDCSQFNGFDFSKYIKITRGNLTLNGEINEISVDFNRRTIQVRGKA